ncbi:MAG: divergent PAP2 family protein [Oscillospiraceae bacterium]|jgi:acid phosphatase family membrane protein YuiD|nr:divergent PAP2 family protein [Oscillospiraceae bacterium]
MSEFIKEYYNVLAVAPIFSFIVAQLLKYVIYAIQYKVFRKERLTGAGGMPSSHSSGVCTLVVIALRVQGAQSPVFALSVILAAIVMYDAAGVRRAAGLHAKELNRLRNRINGLIDEKRDNSEKKKDEEKAKELKEFLGHSPLEVVFGALLGILIGMAFNV